MSDIIPNVVVSMPSQQFTLARKFQAASNGKIYIGKIDSDPTIPENQIQVYLENEDGSTIPVAQPLIIGVGGYPVYNGQIAKYVTVEGHSMAVYDSYGAQQFYYPNVLKYDPDQFRPQLLSMEERVIGIGVSLYNGGNGSYIVNGDVIPDGTTHVTIKINNKLEDFASLSGRLPQSRIIGFSNEINEFLELDIITSNGKFSFVSLDVMKQRIDPDGKFHAVGFGMSQNNDAEKNGRIWDHLYSYTNPGDTIIFPPNSVIKIDRSVASKFRTLVGNNTVFDARGVTSDTFGNGTGKAVINHSGEKPSLLSINVINDIKTGGSEIAFNAAHNLSVGDWFIIYDDHDFSYSSYRAGYKAGQYFEVKEVVSGTIVKTKEPAFQNYTASKLSVYKCNMTTYPITGVIGIAPDTDNVNVMGMVISNALNINCDNCGGKNSNDTSFYIYNSVGVRGVDCIGLQTSQKSASNTVTSQYGVNIVNSYDCHIAGNFTGYRHAAAYGGTSQQINITTRYCSTKGIYRNLINSVNIGACDFHGNTENCSHEGQVISAGGGAVGVMGNKNKVTLSGQVSGVAVVFTELSGVEFDLHFPKLEITGDPTSGTPRFRPIDFSGNGAVFGNDIPENSRETIKISGKIVANEVTENFAVFGNASAGVKGDWRLNVSELEVVAEKALRMWGMNGELPLVKLGSITSSVTINVGTGGSTTSPYFDFPMQFPKPPKITTALRQYTTGTDRISSYVGITEDRRAQIGVYTCSGSNFSRTADITVDYTATLDEF